MSHLEKQLELQIKAMRLPEPVREFAAIPGRRFRFDFAWPDRGVLVECQGAVFVKGGHSTGAGITRDCEKAALAAVNGYRLIPVTGAHIKSGFAIDCILKALGVAA